MEGKFSPHFHESNKSPFLLIIGQIEGLFRSVVLLRVNDWLEVDVGGVVGTGHVQVDRDVEVVGAEQVVKGPVLLLLLFLGLGLSGLCRHRSSCLEEYRSTGVQEYRSPSPLFRLAA